MSNLPPPVEPGLNLEDLAKLKKSEALKRFKALKTVFRNAAKCKGIILLIDFPGFADKKKQSIILPFKKLAELKEQWKKLKKDKPLPLGRVAVCRYELDEAGEVRCTQIFGAAAAEKVQAELTELLGLFKLKVALALDLQPDGDEDEAEVAKTPSNPADILKTLSAQAQALKAKVQAFKALALAEKAQAQEALNQDSLAFVQAAEAQPNLPAPLQTFLGQIKGLLPQLGVKNAPAAPQQNAKPSDKPGLPQHLQRMAALLNELKSLRQLKFT